MRIVSKCLRRFSSIIREQLLGITGKNLGTNPFADVAFTTNPLTYSNNEWQWAYRQSALGGREQKRLMASLPHSDETDNNGKIFAHLWEYSLLGAGGEELIFYKGFQINTNTAPPSNDAETCLYGCTSVW